MEPFIHLTAVAAPLLRDNIDTDAIIPSREMRSVSKTGLADGLFAGWRYIGIGTRDPDPEFVLNQSAYADTRIILGGANFGCGSSREHAAWALAEYGIRAIVASSFNPIFQGNCIRNGIVPVTLDLEAIASLATALAPDPQALRITIDLPTQVLTGPDRKTHAFPIADEAKEMLLDGLDAIDLTLKRRVEIDHFIAADRMRRGWIYPG
ncbi:3-isopropylmalate dehydratase small subunit [Sphingomonas sp. OK281]|uniref:3-isopropylmalate dehydratase small subunit n=1 Tax=Sphingomonas sp. OK281 TaxID=1881067 RepID=UPI0008E89A14|nr:3-isopropylmalate dehydratase small subunit [Sphingomonas sp. OK281]SFN84152.1 3-isopropylmalate/(R)-2-methylmalate dehydratase small subunit [Sphingomonas sp. OK281]